MTTVVKSIPDAAAERITRKVCDDIHSVMIGDIRNKMTDFLAKDLDLANIDFFQMLSSMQPPAAADLAHTAPTLNHTAPALAAVVGPDGEKLIRSEATMGGGNLNEENAIADASQATFDEIPNKLAALFQEDTLLLREALLDGFRELFHALAQDPATMTAFRDALVLRIDHLVKTRPTDHEFRDIYVATKVIHSSLENVADKTMALFDGMRPSSDATEMPPVTSTLPESLDPGAGFAVNAIRRQRAKRDALHQDMQTTHSKLGAFMQKVAAFAVLPTNRAGGARRRMKTRKKRGGYHRTMRYSRFGKRSLLMLS